MTNEYRGDQHVHTYAYLRAAASRALTRAEQLEQENAQDPPEPNAIAALVLTFFAIEAFVNDVGKSLVQGFEMKGKVSKKFRVVVRSLGLDPGLHIFRCFHELRRLRNGWAHGESTVQQVLPGQRDPNKDPRFSPLPMWQELCTARHARRLFDEVTRLTTVLEEAANKQLLAQGRAHDFFLGSLRRQSLEVPMSNSPAPRSSPREVRDGTCALCLLW